MFRISPAFLSCFVISRSSFEGVRLPEGWLWATMIEFAFLVMAVLKISLGWMIQLLRVPIDTISLEIMLRSVSRQKTMKPSFVQVCRSLVCSKTFFGSLRIIFSCSCRYTVSSSESSICISSEGNAHVYLLAFPSECWGKVKCDGCGSMIKMHLEILRCKRVRTTLHLQHSNVIRLRSKLHQMHPHFHQG